jgi:hypothetical protein
MGIWFETGVFGLRAQDAALGMGCGQQMNALQIFIFLAQMMIAELFSRHSFRDSPRKSAT